MKRAALLTALCVGLLFLLESALETEGLAQNAFYQGLQPRRKLLELGNGTYNKTPSKTNCTPAGINQFPPIMMKQWTRIHGGIVVHILLAFYCCLALEIVCDEYFVPALDIISNVLKIKPDVAGATFMASGTSAPALAATIIGVFVTKDDVGVGTIVGSAVFNIAFVVSICGLFTGKVLYLNWWPIFRDNLFYIVSIIALICVIWDSLVTWWESTILLFIYVLYIMFMFVNDRLERYFTNLAFLNCLKHKGLSTSELCLDLSHASSLEAGIYTVNGGGVPPKTCKTREKDPVEMIPVGTASPLPNGQTVADPLFEVSRTQTILSMPSGSCKRAWFVVSCPILVACYLSIPDCRLERWKKWYVLTFFMSCAWVGLYSYILVWMANIIGFTFKIPDSVMGLTFLAAGVSLPDVFTSLIVAKQGEGDMAVSNAVASNVFNILICLGLPWFLQNCIAEPGSKISVSSTGMINTNACLVITAFFLIVVTYLNGWKLNRKYGAIMLVWYLLFMTVATLYELNFFGKITSPTCDSNY